MGQIERSPLSVPLINDVPAQLDAAASHYLLSSAREKLLEHLFVGELLRCLWRNGRRDAEVLRSEVDNSGHDLVIDSDGVLRQIQLKASHRLARTSSQNISRKLASKPSGCVVWIQFDPDTMALGPFLWLGGSPGAPLPNLGDKVARHTKGDSKSRKTLRTAMRVVRKGQFTLTATMEDLAIKLFGTGTKQAPSD